MTTDQQADSSQSASAGSLTDVGFDLRYITRGASGGITPLITETVKALHAIAPELRLHIFGTMFNRDVVDIEAEGVRHYTLPLHGYYQQLENVLEQQSISVLFRSFPNDDQLGFPLSKQIVLIPDLQHEFFPSFFSEAAISDRRRNFSRLITGCGAVATISEHAAATIRERYSAKDIFIMSPSSQIRDALHEAVDPAFRQRVEALKPFFYYPANLWPHKNHPALLQAFDLFRKRHPAHTHYHLVLTGFASGWEAMAAAHPSSGVTHIGFVSKAELVFLYRTAEALTFVSLFEGFGMPVLEAFGVGCPVICSDTTSLPEVAGGAALLCDPTDPAAIAGRMGEIVGNPALRRALIEKGMQRFEAYSWTDAAAHLRSAIDRVAYGTVLQTDRERAKPERQDADGNSSAPAEPSTITPAEAPGAEAFLPLVSIVTPSFNQGRFLRRTIESVLNQDYPRIEYVVMDGGSTDESIDILKSYGERVRWISEPDRGQTHAINKGLALCSGQIQAYLNSDDVLVEGAISTVVSFFAAHGEVDFVYGKADYIDPDDSITGEYATADYSFERLVDDCCICQPAAFWRSSVRDAIGGFDESLNLTMDYDYWLRIGANGFGVRHLPVKLAHSRLYPETKTKSARGKIYEEIFAISLRHARRVSRSYVQGYWDYRLHEVEGIFTKMARKFPALERLLVEYDSHRFASLGRSHGQALAHTTRKAWHAARRRVAGRLKRAPVLAPLTAGVAGVYADNWLAPQVTMSPSPTRDRRLVLEGVAPKSVRLRVEAGDQVLAEQEIEGGVVTRLAFQGASRPIRLVFDDFIVDAASRKLSFLVQFTNCFAEHEI